MANIAFVFPGQGSQKVGMSKDLVEDHPRLLDEYFLRADDILGMPLSTLCFEGPEEELRSTDNTQPAIFVTSMAILDVVRQAGLAPRAVAGHSLGEYSALVCAGVLSFEDGLRLVRRRGELMAVVNETTPGTMAAIIGLASDAIEEMCVQAAGSSGEVVEPANFNEPMQTVISGQVAAVEAAGALAAEAGARVVPLQVGAPFHCSLMDAMAEEFAAELDRYTFEDPRVGVVANATGDWVRSAATVKEALRRQVAGAVRWTHTLRRLEAEGCDTLVEIGPGRVLGGLAMKTVPEMATQATGDRRRLMRTLEALA